MVYQGFKGKSDFRKETGRNHLDTRLGMRFQVTSYVIRWFSDPY